LDKLPESLYFELGKRLEEGLYSGIGTNVSLNTLDNPTYINTLRNNIWTFSGAKTWQQINEMSAFLLDENGNERTFKEYKDYAKKTFNDYNVNYLRTEINHAQGSGQMADKWQQIDDEKDIFPYLKYVTAGDERVRSSHKALNGVIKRVDSPFWNENSPLNGWNCRCDLVQLDEAEETPDSKIEVPTDTPDYMKGNPGREVFGKEHPYFKVPKAFEKDKANNFNMPSPPPVSSAKLKTILKKEKKKFNSKKK
jgi:SPP1 gp7 family putative phage head morphogenesis protein